MRQLIRSTALVLNSLPRSHRFLLGSLSAITLLICFWHLRHPAELFSYRDKTNEKPASVIENSEPIDQPTLADILPMDDLDDKAGSVPDTQDYVIAGGDSLHSILQQYDIDAADISRLTDADKQLHHLKIGQQLSWRTSTQGELQQLNWQISRKEIRHYQRVGDAFVMHSARRHGDWQNQRISGQVTGSFVNSARQAGLNTSEINAVVKAVQWQLDFRKLQKGDKFTVLLASETLDGQREQSQLLGVRLHSAGKDYYAIHADDGNYYDRNGNGLTRGFLRFPSARRYSVSSEFNLRRVHPVTGRVAPHKGVDFAMPTGTPILAVGDGEIIESKYSSTAGHYLTIRHSRSYVTRYLHLQKILVRPGQKVKRGDRVALSGNSGLSTGPHLHYELWVNQQAVNPLTAKLPQTQGMTGNDRRVYLKQAKQIIEKLQFD